MRGGSGRELFEDSCPKGVALAEDGFDGGALAWFLRF